MTKAKRVTEVRQLLDSKEFLSWFAQYEELQAQLQNLAAKDHDPLVHLLLRAGEFEELSAQAEVTNGIVKDLSAIIKGGVSSSRQLEDLS